MAAPVPIVPSEGDTYTRRYAESRIDWSTFWTKEFAVEEWAIEPFLPRGRSVALYSPAKAGKSLFVLDVLTRVATGQRVLDHPRGDPLTVVYFDLEMTDGDVYERLDDMGYGPEWDLSHLHYYVLPNLPPLDTPAGGEAVVALAREHEADIVVFDTTSRVISGKENDSDTLLSLYRNTGRPLKELGCTVLRLDHAGKDTEKGQRGTSAKNDDVDLVWELRPREGGLLLRATHRRQAWIPEAIELVRRESPLRHELAMAGATWPGGTEACAEVLDSLNVPLDIKLNAAQRLLRENNAGVRREVISAALKFRKHIADQTGTTSGTTSIGPSGTDYREPWEPDSGTTSEPPGTTPHGDWEPQSLSREGLVSQPTTEVCSECLVNPPDAGPSWPDLCDECAIAAFNTALVSEEDTPW